MDKRVNVSKKINPERCSTIEEGKRSGFMLHPHRHHGNALSLVSTTVDRITEFNLQNFMKVRQIPEVRLGKQLLDDGQDCLAVTNDFLL